MHVRKLFESGHTLAQRTVRGGIWVSALRATTRLSVLVRTIVLAALLAPEDFGVIGVAMLATTSLEMFTQTGFEAALVQKKGEIQEYLDTAWTAGIVRGAILFAVLFFSAPLIATFFRSPESIVVIRVIALATILRGLANIGVVYFQKDLEFNKLFLYEVSSTLADLVVAITAAVLLRNVWALVLGLLAGLLVRCVASYLVHPFRPRLGLKANQAMELYGFGKWVLGSSVILFLITQGDNAFVGRVLGVAALGLYQLAYNISNAPTTEITHTLSQVAFPAYSQLQEDKQRLTRAYARVLQMTTLMSFPLAMGILVLGPDFVRVFLGEEWSPMIEVLQLLVIWGAIRSVGATTGPLFSGTGRPDFLTKLTLLQLVLLVALIYPFTRSWGLTGVAAAVLLAALVPNALALCAVARSLGCSVTVLLAAISSPFLASAVMGVVILLARTAFGTAGLGKLLVLVAFGTLTYAGAVMVVDTVAGAGLVGSVRSLLKSLAAE